MPAWSRVPAARVPTAKCQAASCMARLLRSLEQLLSLFRFFAWLAPVMAVVTLGIVVARYSLSAGSIAVQESVVFMHAALFMLCTGYTLQQDGHVRIDVFYRRFKPRTRSVVNLLGTLLLLLPTAAALLWFSLDYVARAWEISEQSPDSAMPIYLLKTLQPVMAVLLALGGFAQVALVVRELAGGSHNNA